MTTERCRVCGTEGDGGAGCFTSDEDICAECYGKLAETLRGLCERYTGPTVLGYLASALESLADRTEDRAAVHAARSVEEAAGYLRQHSKRHAASLADALTVIGEL